MTDSIRHMKSIDGASMFSGGTSVRFGGRVVLCSRWINAVTRLHQQAPHPADEVGSWMMEEPGIT